MGSKKKLDPTLQQAVKDEAAIDKRMMTKRRGRPRKEESENSESEVRTISKHVRYTAAEWDVVEKKMKENHQTNFAEHARNSTQGLRPIIIGTDDFVLLRQARRDFVNFINASGIKKLSDDQRRVVLQKKSTLYEWAMHLQKIVEQIENLLDRLHYKLAKNNNNKEEGR